jgi:hypothetical protein
MAGMSSAKTRFALLPGHDEEWIICALLKQVEKARCISVHTRKLRISAILGLTLDSLIG